MSLRWGVSNLRGIQISRIRERMYHIFLGKKQVAGPMTGKEANTFLNRKDLPVHASKYRIVEDEHSRRSLEQADVIHHLEATGQIPAKGQWGDRGKPEPPPTARVRRGW